MDSHLFLAYDYPVLGAFWTVMWIFLWVMWLLCSASSPTSSVTTG